MDPLALIIVGGLGGLVVAMLLLGWSGPGHGPEAADWHPAQSAQNRAQDEADDLEQMLEAANRRRRRRGEAELTEASLRQSVAQDVDENHARRDTSGVDEEIVQLLEVKNRRRIAKGLAPISAEEYRRVLESVR